MSDQVPAPEVAAALDALARRRDDAEVAAYHAEWDAFAAHAHPPPKPPPKARAKPRPSGFTDRSPMRTLPHFPPRQSVLVQIFFAEREGTRAPARVLYHRVQDVPSEEGSS